MNKMNCRKTNPRLTSLISLLKTTSRENEVNIWRDIADRLEAPSKNYAEVNLRQDQPVCCKRGDYHRPRQGPWQRDDRDVGESSRPQLLRVRI